MSVWVSETDPWRQLGFARTGMWPAMERFVRGGPAVGGRWLYGARRGEGPPVPPRPTPADTAPGLVYMRPRDDTDTDSDSGAAATAAAPCHYDWLLDLWTRWAGPGGKGHGVWTARVADWVWDGDLQLLGCLEARPGSPMERGSINEVARVTYAGRDCVRRRPAGYHAEPAADDALIAQSLQLIVESVFHQWAHAAAAADTRLAHVFVPELVQGGLDESMAYTQVLAYCGQPLCRAKAALREPRVLMAVLAQAMCIILALDERLGMVHGDLHTGNLCWTAEPTTIRDAAGDVHAPVSLHLVDFGAASVPDPAGGRFYADSYVTVARYHGARGQPYNPGVRRLQDVGNLLAELTLLCAHRQPAHAHAHPRLSSVFAAYAGADDIEHYLQQQRALPGHAHELYGAMCDGDTAVDARRRGVTPQSLYATKVYPRDSYMQRVAPANLRAGLEPARILAYLLEQLRLGGCGGGADETE